jgi:hypothetical protein
MSGAAAPCACCGMRGKNGLRLEDEQRDQRRVPRRAHCLAMPEEAALLAAAQSSPGCSHIRGELPKADRNLALFAKCIGNDADQWDVAIIRTPEMINKPPASLRGVSGSR